MSWYPSYQYSTRSPGAYTGGYANPGQSNQNYAGLPSYLTNSSLWQGYSQANKNAIADVYKAGGTLQGIPGAAAAGGGLTADQNWQNQFNQLMGQAPAFNPTPTPGQSNAMLGPGATSKSYDVIANGQPAQFGGPNPPVYGAAPGGGAPGGLPSFDQFNQTYRATNAPPPIAWTGTGPANQYGVQTGGTVGGLNFDQWQQAWGQYMDTEKAAYKSKYGVDPVMERVEPGGSGGQPSVGQGAGAGVPGTMSDPGLNKTGPGGIQYPTSPGAGSAGGTQMAFDLPIFGAGGALVGSTGAGAAGGPMSSGLEYWYSHPEFQKAAGSYAGGATPGAIPGKPISQEEMTKWLTGQGWKQGTTPGGDYQTTTSFGQNWYMPTNQWMNQSGYKDLPIWGADRNQTVAQLTAPTGTPPTATLPTTTAPAAPSTSSGYYGQPAGGGMSPLFSQGYPTPNYNQNNFSDWYYLNQLNSGF